MSDILDKIHKYMISFGVDEKDLPMYDTSSVFLAIQIAEYGHRNQKREIGEEYVNHPLRVLNTYRELVGIKPNDHFCIDKDLMYEFNVPFEGVQEVCLLHDIIEDTEFSLDDVRNLYIECGFGRYFDLYIKNPLENITHDKSVDYEDYIKICLKNPISALVKMIDLEDNLRVLDLIELNDGRYLRAQKYLYFIFLIDKVYHFVENINKYRKAFKETSGN